MSAQPWICGSCRSINQPREGRCYRCRTPRELVEANPETLLVAGAGSRPTEEVRPTGTFRSSSERAFLTQVLIVGAMVVTVVGTILGADLVTRILDGEAVAGDASATLVAIVGGVGLLVAATAVVAFALWLSRVVANIPAVGLGWPNVTPTQAIYESIFPGVNLYRVPAVIRDIANRLEPNGRGEALLAAAWLGLVGGILLPRIAGWGIVFLAGSLEDFIALRLVVGQFALGLTLVGGVFLIALIQWVESRMEARAAGAPAVEPLPAAPSAPAAEAGIEPAVAPPARPVPAAPSAHWTAAARGSVANAQAPDAAPDAPTSAG